MNKDLNIRMTHSFALDLVHILIEAKEPMTGRQVVDALREYCELLESQLEEQPVSGAV